MIGEAPRIAGTVGREHDNFGLMRHLLALAVVVSHAVSLGKTGLARDEIGHALTGFTLGEHAVNGFFAISGFLIAMSWDRRPRALTYLTARFLRLIPGLVGAVLFATFVIGPAMTSLPLADYFRNRETWSFLWETILRLKSTGTLPGVFSSNPIDIVMGTVWSLKFELGCYVGLFALGMLGLMKQRWAVLALVLFFALGIVMIDALHLPVSPSRATGFRLRFLFSLGAALYVWRQYVPLSGWIAAGLGALVIALATTPLYQAMLLAAEAYGVLYLALAPNLTLPKLEMPFDLSYGIYLYGMPVQQVLVARIPVENPYSLLPPALILTIAIAALSWYGIERPALRLKARLFPAGSRGVAGPVIESKPIAEPT